jgi:hypothetical protein
MSGDLNSVQYHELRGSQATEAEGQGRRHYPERMSRAGNKRSKPHAIPTTWLVLVERLRFWVAVDLQVSGIPRPMMTPTLLMQMRVHTN